MGDESKIEKGDRVLFPAGRGGSSKSEGRVVNIMDGMATIETRNGHQVNRRIARLEKVTVPDASV